ncbi:HTH-type transcriptional regulator GlpR [Haloarcula amylovorans]|uniref:HTH-type transcriptional regulator GlpR n=1 Tax=Haloarcula amylovorans TaxID=2562280 RepID=UPI001076717C|nr:HTH-type transcriptional regulator GlpR [Halomicroarcula amylolytica]
MMDPEKRRRKIVEIVTNNGGLTVAEIADQIEFSKSTVRRDLNHLDERELIERTHGGAIPATNAGSEPSFDERAVQGLEQKRAIGIRAAEEITEGQVVFFDSGSTTFQIAKAAPKDGSFLAVTNSPLLAMELTKGDGNVKMTGGSLRANSMGLVGPAMENYIKSSNIDIAFIGTNGLDEDGSISVPIEIEASLKTTVVENSAHPFIVTESEKFGVKNFREFATLDDIDAIVTDQQVSATYRELFEETDTECLIADAD